MRLCEKIDQKSLDILEKDVFEEKMDYFNNKLKEYRLYIKKLDNSIYGCNTEIELVSHGPTRNNNQRQDLYFKLTKDKETSTKGKRWTTKHSTCLILMIFLFVIILTSANR